MVDPWDSPPTSGNFGGVNEPQGSTFGTYPLASFGQRAMAWLIDIVLLAVIGEILTRINPSESNGLSALIDIGYMVVLLGGPYGQTVGAKIARVRVVNMNGRQLGYLRGTARYFVSGISAIILGLGYLWMLKDPKKQTLHDKVAGSLVISLVPQVGVRSFEKDDQNSPFNY